MGGIEEEGPWSLEKSRAWVRRRHEGKMLEGGKYGIQALGCCREGVSSMGETIVGEGIVLVVVS